MGICPAAPASAQPAKPAERARPGQWRPVLLCSGPSQVHTRIRTYITSSWAYPGRGSQIATRASSSLEEENFDRISRASSQPIMTKCTIVPTRCTWQQFASPCPDCLRLPNRYCPKPHATMTAILTVCRSGSVVVNAGGTERRTDGRTDGRTGDDSGNDNYHQSPRLLTYTTCCPPGTYMYPGRHLTGGLRRCSYYSHHGHPTAVTGARSSGQTANRWSGFQGSPEMPCDREEALQSSRELATARTAHQSGPGNPVPAHCTTHASSV
jgi:hypothetical protein